MYPSNFDKALRKYKMAAFRGFADSLPAQSILIHSAGPLYYALTSVNFEQVFRSCKFLSLVRTLYYRIYLLQLQSEAIRKMQLRGLLQNLKALNTSSSDIRKEAKARSKSLLTIFQVIA